MKSLSIILLLVPTMVFAWGKTGHRVVGEIAQSHLTDLASLEVKLLLKNERLSEASVWPDRIKSDPKLRKKYNHWHYLNARKGVSKVAKREKKKKGDILTAIQHFTQVLKNKKNPSQDRVEALRFLVHLIGDLHQPLHTGYSSDRGGNDIKLKWFNEDTTLHNVWDENIIDLEELSFTEYAAKINHPTAKQIKNWQKSKPLEWAQESRDYLPKTYEFKERKYWEYDYSYRHLKFLNERLLKGGVRLAGLLNNLFI